MGAAGWSATNSTIKSARLEPRFGGARVLMHLHAAIARKKDSGATEDLQFKSVQSR
jgi:hypothetical protein